MLCKNSQKKCFVKIVKKKSHTKNVQHNSFSLMKALQLNVQIVGMEIITEMNL